MDGIASVLIGTSGLAIAGIVSFMLTVSRADLTPGAAPTIQKIATAGLLLQIGHFFEESATHFYVAFPELLGLAAWPLTFFLSFNLAWFAVWAVAIAFLTRAGRFAIFPLWFLGIASVANGVVHPTLALITFGYFPGFWTSPLVGVAGLVLVRELARATKRLETRLS